MEPTQTPPQAPVIPPNPAPTPPMPGGVLPPEPVQPPPAPSLQYPMPPKKSKARVVITIILVIIGLIVLLALVPTPPEENGGTAQLGPERSQPAGTRIERFNDHKVEMAIPEGWELADEVEFQNSGGVEESVEEVKKNDLVKLFVDHSYLDSEESPTVSLIIDKHNYVTDEIAFDRITKDLEKGLSEANGHNVPVRREEVRVGKHSKYKAYLYSYEDTFDKTTVEKVKYYRVYLAAHGKYYFSFGFYPVQASAKYDEVVKQAVLSINPDE